MRIVVIGAGAVGLATARELAIRGHETYVLEAASHPGAGITSRNSEVVHAGLYYPPDSLKARMCREGSRLLYDYLERAGVDYQKCGKLVVAADESEVSELEALLANALACGVGGLEIVDAATAREIAPAVRCVAALFSPATGVLDSWGYVRALRRDVERAGGAVVLRAAVRGAEACAGGFRLTVEVGGVKEPFECDAVANCAGLEADRIARLPLDGDEPLDLPAHRYVRGSYARMRWPASGPEPPRRLVYPLPNRDAPGLGVHLTVDLAGGLRLGPDAEELPTRVEDYSIPDGVAARFEAAARRYLYLPEGVSIEPDFAGIRPVRTDSSGSRDFYVAEESGRGLARWVNLIGIESPGLSASPALGGYAADLLEGRERSTNAHD